MHVRVVLGSVGIARYVGVDIADKSLEKLLVNRLPSMRPTDIHAVSHLIVADMGRDDLTSTPLRTYVATTSSKQQVSALKTLGQGAGPQELAHIQAEAGFKINSTCWELQVPLTTADQFDIISCQFALHYFFQVK